MCKLSSSLAMTGDVGSAYLGTKGSPAGADLWVVTLGAEILSVCAMGHCVRGFLLGWL